jgi:hypothetical protein
MIDELYSELLKLESEFNKTNNTKILAKMLKSISDYEDNTDFSTEEQEAINEIVEEINKINDEIFNKSEETYYIYDSWADDSELEKFNVNGRRFKYNNTNLTNNMMAIYNEAGFDSLLPWMLGGMRFMQNRDSIRLFDYYIDKELKSQNYNGDEEKLAEYIIKNQFDADSYNASRNLICMIFKGGKLMAKVIAYVKEYGDDLHWAFVWVNPMGAQGGGYASKLLDLLMGYLSNVNAFKDIKKISLEYAADKPSGWIAYNKECNLYDFWNKVILKIYREWKHPFAIESQDGVDKIHQALEDVYNNMWESQSLLSDKDKEQIKKMKGGKIKKGVLKETRSYYEIEKALDKFNTY